VFKLVCLNLRVVTVYSKSAICDSITVIKIHVLMKVGYAKAESEYILGRSKSNDQTGSSTK